MLVARTEAGAGQSLGRELSTALSLPYEEERAPNWADLIGGLIGRGVDNMSWPNPPLEPMIDYAISPSHLW